MLNMESLTDFLLKCYDGSNGGLYFTFPARLSSCLSLLANPVIAAVSIIPASKCWSNTQNQQCHLPSIYEGNDN